MSLEKELRGIYDRTKKIVDRIEHARDQLAKQDMATTAYELGCSLAEAQQLVNEMGQLAQRHFYETKSCSTFMADTMTDSRCIHCGKTRAEHNPGVRDG